MACHNSMEGMGAVCSSQDRERVDGAMEARDWKRRNPNADGRGGCGIGEGEALQQRRDVLLAPPMEGTRPLGAKSPAQPPRVVSTNAAFVGSSVRREGSRMLMTLPFNPQARPTLP